MYGMYLADVLIGKAVLILFICICAYQDMRTKHIDLRLCFGFYAMEAMIYVYATLRGNALNYRGIVLGVIPAILIFILSKLSRSSIGMGDGYFFLGLGFGMGIARVSETIFYLLLILALVSLILVVYYFFQNQSGQKKSIPLIPFAALPAAFAVLG